MSIRACLCFDSSCAGKTDERYCEQPGTYGPVTAGQFAHIAERCRSALTVLESNPTQEQITAFARDVQILRGHFGRTYQLHTPQDTLVESCEHPFHHFRELAQLLDRYHALPKKGSTFVWPSVQTTAEIKKEIQETGILVEQNAFFFVIGRIASLFASKESASKGEGKASKPALPYGDNYTSTYYANLSVVQLGNNTKVYG